MDVEISWLGHATVLIATGGLRVLTDPLLRTRLGPLKRVGAPAALSGQAVDIVLISHLHADHADPSSLRALRADVPILAPPATAAWLRERGFSHVRDDEEARFGDIVIRRTPARHDGRRWPVGAPQAAAGFLVEGPAPVYFAGDTDLYPEMESLAGRVDVALLPIWGWGPTLGPGHLDPVRAAKAAKIIRPGLAIPIHWGTFAPFWSRPSSADLSEPARRFGTEMTNAAPDVEARVLQPGETTRWCAHPRSGRRR